MIRTKFFSASDIDEKVPAHMGVEEQLNEWLAKRHLVAEQLVTSPTLSTSSYHSPELGGGVTTCILAVTYRETPKSAIDQAVELLWSRVFSLVGHIDDAGCDWLVVGNSTYIAHTGWLVSDDPEVAYLIRSIYLARGYAPQYYPSLSAVPEHLSNDYQPA